VQTHYVLAMIEPHAEWLPHELARDSADHPRPGSVGADRYLWCLLPPVIHFSYPAVMTEPEPAASRVSNPVVEVRTYRTKPGRRAEFVKLFQTRGGPAQLDYGMTVIGPLLDKEDPDVMVWLRAFPSAEQRQPIKNAFYEGQLWKEQLEHLALPLLAEYSAVVCDMPEDFLDGPLRAQQWR
jgi:hypothetical protein